MHVNGMNQKNTFVNFSEAEKYGEKTHLSALSANLIDYIARQNLTLTIKKKDKTLTLKGDNILENKQKLTSIFFLEINRIFESNVIELKKNTLTKKDYDLCLKMSYANAISNNKIFNFDDFVKNLDRSYQNIEIIQHIRKTAENIKILQDKQGDTFASITMLYKKLLLLEDQKHRKISLSGVEVFLMNAENCESFDELFEDVETYSVVLLKNKDYICVSLTIIALGTISSLIAAIAYHYIQ